MKTSSFDHLLRSYLVGFAEKQRRMSPHTICSYRDMWRLFLTFLSDKLKKAITNLTLEDMTPKNILAFLDYLEEVRQVSVSTRNIRLAALRSFFRYVSKQEPTAIEQCNKILNICAKKHAKRKFVCMNVEEVNAIQAQIDKTTPQGLRDHVIVSILHNTGTRIQEVLNLRLGDICFSSIVYINVIGKGDKERQCPLWPETVNVVQKFLKYQPRSDHERMFVNRVGTPLTAAGFRFKLKKYIKGASLVCPSLKHKKVTPHVFRHTSATQLLDAGIDLVSVKNFLGHASIESTLIYLHSSIESKRKAIETADDSARPTKPPKWKSKPELITFLDNFTPTSGAKRWHKETMKYKSANGPATRRSVA